MGFLSRLLRRKERQPTKQVEVSEPVCPHSALIPYWDSAEDLGKPEKVSRYTCQACDAPFSAEEAERLKATEAERLRLANIERLAPQQEESTDSD